MDLFVKYPYLHEGWYYKPYLASFTELLRSHQILVERKFVELLRTISLCILKHNFNPIEIHSGLTIAYTELITVVHDDSDT